MVVAANKEKLGFQTEVKQLLHLVIHSLYSNKEIFLRELVSNASDAVDKLRFSALSDSELVKHDADFKIWVDFDKDARTITIRDNGIGMSRDEVIANLGTIAKSGTKEFLANLTGDQAKDRQLIGQFGVGFYSAFIIASEVEVKTRRAGLPADEGVCWISKGEGDYEIESISKADRGTEITLKLKADEDEFLDAWRLRNIITKYSDHIDLPVLMKKQLPPTEEGKEAEVPAEEYEAINQAKALWTRSRTDVKETEYNELYKHISHDFEDPLAYSHNKVEGKLEYTSLLFIPQRAPFDLWQREAKRGLKLYVQRVFIMDEAEQFLPSYLRFVRGIIDSNDLPLNVSRELLQSNRQVDSMRNALTKRVLDMLEKLVKNDPEKYEKFWEQFGAVLKEGPAEDFTNKEKIAKLLRFASTHTDTDKQSVSFEDYVSRMQKGQDKIYFLTAETFAAAKNSPYLEIFRKKGIEVLLLSDRVDEWLAAHLTEFDGKALQSVNKGNLDLGDLEDKEEKQQQEQVEKDFSSLIKQVKETLGDKVKEVRLTHRLTDSPACLVFDENELSGQMQRMLKSAGQDIPESKPILELNPEHQLVLKLKADDNSTQFKDLTEVLFEQSVLAEGGQLDDPASFIKRLNTLLVS